MAYQWLSEQELEIREANPLSSPHLALEPVSAWLFRQDSQFLVSGGMTGDDMALFSMAIDRSGFDASAEHAFKARKMSSPHGRANLGHLFNDAFLDPILQSIEDSIIDPSVFVLPIAANSVERDLVLKSRQGIGDPPDEPAPPSDLPPPKAIIGIIDHGINIFHRRFRTGETGSRVANAWFQGARRDGNLPIGTEWSRSRIEAALAGAGDDEDALLRQIGADFEQPGFRPLAQRTSHGTHVLDIAAGMDPQNPDGAEYPIIAVTLPPEVTRETSGSMMALPFVLGLEYILDRARRLFGGAEDAPQVVINFSFGLSGGPRLGHHHLEQTVHRLAERHVEKTGSGKPPVVVVAAGNRNMARSHALSEPGATSFSVTWHTQPADPTSNFLELRIEAAPNTVTGLQLDLTPPGKTEALRTTLAVPPAKELDGAQLLSKGGVFVGRASVRTASEHVTILTLALAPSDPGSTGGPAAPAGDWLISVEPLGGTAERIHAYALRDDVPYGFRDGGRQSYFVDPAYADHDEQGRPLADDPAEPSSVIRRAGTLNAIATGERHLEDTRILWTVGAYTGPDSSGQLSAADYSAAPLEGGIEQVDCSSQGDRSKVLPGVVAAGTRSGSRVQLNGTSVAAPQMVRHLAMGHGSLQVPPENARKSRVGRSVLIFE